MAHAVRAAFALILASATASGQPDIVFETLEKHLGVVKPDTELPSEVAFPFRNEGDETLRITRWGGCASQCRTDKREYAPGESGVVLVPVRRALAYGPQDGERGCPPRIWTNDPDHGEVELRLSADVWPSLWAMSDGSGIEPVGKDEGPAFVVPVYARDLDLSLLQATVSHSRINGELSIDLGSIESLRWARTGEMVSRRAVIARILPGGELGYQEFTIRISHPDSEDPIWHGVWYVHLGDLMIEPHPWKMGARTPGELLEHRFVVRSRTHRPFRIFSTSIERDEGDPAVEVILDQGDARAVSHGVTVRTTFPHGRNVYRGRLTLHTDVEREESIELRWFGQAASPDPGG